MLEAETRIYDVVIVGGGIAGLSIAERLSREASRQDKRIKILVVEREREFGSGASSRLEGWYHTGALYSKSPDLRFLDNCIRAYEDLYNWYFYDPQFLRRANCNLRELTTENKQPGYQIESRPNAWFSSTINFLLPFDLDRLGSRYGLRYDLPKWEQTCEQVRRLVAHAYYIENWRNNDLNCCQCPHSEDIIDKLFSVEERKEGGFSEILRRHDRDTSWVESTIEQLSRSLSIPLKANFEFVGSLDAVMNTAQVMADLAYSAACRGVDFLAGYELDPDYVQIPRYGKSETITGVVFRPTGDKEGRKLLHVVGHHYVFAIGLGFDEESLLRDRLDLRVRVEKQTSVMVVVKPHLSEQSFVRMDYYPGNDFNHMYRPGPDGSVGWSVIADSNALPEDANHIDCARAAEHLIAKARRYFQTDLRDHQTAWYSCVKTEFPISEDSNREYSYWFGPLWQDWNDGAWAAAREENQKAAQYAVQEFARRHFREIAGGSGVMSDEIIREKDSMPDEIGKSNWALKKWLHFTLLQTALDQHSSPSAYEHVSGHVRTCYSDRYLTNASLKPNFVCVVPGKFSLFPTLAYQVYLEMEVRGVFSNLPPGALSRVDPVLPTIAHSYADTLFQSIR